MFNIVKRIKRYLYSFTLIESDTPLQTSGKEVSVKECTRDQATKKRVANAFKQQAQQMQARRASHKFSCNDTLTCSGCYELVPDKIVSEPYKLKKRPMRRMSEYKKRDKDDSGCT